MNRSTHRSVIYSSLAILALGLSACGSSDPAAEAPPSMPSEAGSSASAPHGYVEGAQEASEPQLRLAVHDGQDGSLEILDLLTEESVAEENGGSQTRIGAADNRYLFETDGEAGQVRVYDSGVWTVDHGDHVHYYTSGVSEVDEVSGDEPGHVVSHDASVAVFFDGDGAVKVYDRKPLEDGELTETMSIETGAHHGLAVPFNDHVITTTPQDDGPDELPGELALYSGGGQPAELSGQTDCSQIHGAGATSDAAAFACDAGVLTVDEDFGSTLQPYPEQAEGRAWTLTAGSDLLIAPFEGSGLGLLDPATGSWTHVATGAEVISAGISPDDGTALALDADGVGYAIDPETGEILSSRELVQVPSDEDENEESSPAPTVAVDDERAYVSDPAGGRVLELDVADGLREARSFAAGGQPTQIAVMGR
ncbi:PQQ-like beta-propeller repeat protein [Kocuria coralli]|uniref:PQQ-like beta-propeller repeat protein n=1 Tax=Kocuria coralli TaxID=1461025 RepID=A0A5J5KWN4_9MICC|nr:PQQ-like beta-propeller repeat protein [Kocuria coralli]KAA9393325.1 PQQ-like beta-propeller repeat protein [Kocuria coralli]